MSPQGDPARDDLVKAAKSLMRDVRGMIAIAENDLREVLGVTNVNVLKRKADDVEAALAGVETPPQEGR